MHNFVWRLVQITFMDKPCHITVFKNKIIPKMEFLQFPTRQRSLAASAVGAINLKQPDIKLTITNCADRYRETSSFCGGSGVTQGPCWLMGPCRWVHVVTDGSMMASGQISILTELGRCCHLFHCNSFSYNYNK